MKRVVISIAVILVIVLIVTLGEPSSDPSVNVDVAVDTSPPVGRPIIKTYKAEKVIKKSVETTVETIRADIKKVSVIEVKEEVVKSKITTKITSDHQRKKLEALLKILDERHSDRLKRYDYGRLKADEFVKMQYFMVTLKKPMTDDEMELFSYLPNLKILKIGFMPSSRKDSTFTGEGLRHLKDLKELKSIRVSGFGDKMDPNVERALKFDFPNLVNVESNSKYAYKFKVNKE